MENQENKTKNGDLLFPILVQNFTVIIRIVVNDHVINEQDKMRIIQHANELISIATISFLNKKNLDFERDVNPLIEYFFTHLEKIEAKYQKPLKMMNLIHSYL